MAKMSPKKLNKVIKKLGLDEGDENDRHIIKALQVANESEGRVDKGHGSRSQNTKPFSSI